MTLTRCKVDDSDFRDQPFLREVPKPRSEVVAACSNFNGTASIVMSESPMHGFLIPCPSFELPVDEALIWLPDKNIPYSELRSESKRIMLVSTQIVSGMISVACKPF